MQTQLLYEFPAEGELWSSIDDPVMGGRSRSRMHAVDGVAVFEGFVSLENNGGFCSVRSRPEARDLSAFDGLRLRIRGEAKRYAFRLRTDAGLDGVSYQAKFETAPDGWAWVELPFEAFIPVFRGRRVMDWPLLDAAQIQSFGLLIADEQEGPFRLEIERIEAFAGKATP